MEEVALGKKQMEAALPKKMKASCVSQLPMLYQ